MSQRRDECGDFWQNINEVMEKSFFHFFFHQRKWCGGLGLNHQIVSRHWMIITSYFLCVLSGFEVLRRYWDLSLTGLGFLSTEFFLSYHHDWSLHWKWVIGTGKWSQTIGISVNKSVLRWCCCWMNRDTMGSVWFLFFVHNFDIDFKSLIVNSQ